MSKRPDLAERNRLNAKHGMWRTPTYKAWSTMRERCNCPTHTAYKDYGGRGITICTRWNDFANFLSDMGEKPEGFSLDRIDNNGNYEPENCRWADMRVQCNNRRSNKRLTFNGISLTIAEWARKIGIHPKALGYRIRSGWPLEVALTSKMNHGKRRVAR